MRQNKMVQFVIVGVLLALSTRASEPEVDQVVEQGTGPSRGLASSESEGEYSFRWLDPDKKIYVLQNRKYRKSRHLLVSALFGRGLNGTYRSSFNIDPRLSYYFTEELGFEVFYSHFLNSETSTYQNLVAASPTTLPNIREVTGMLGVNFKWVPWYSKINVFNEILYFDWFFSIGLGKVNLRVDTRSSSTASSTYVQQSPLGLFLGMGQMFHVSESFLIRLDLLGAIYKAEAVSKNETSASVSNFNFSIGAGLKL